MKLFSNQDNLKTIKEGAARKARTNAQLKKKKIAICSSLPEIESSAEVTLKPVDVICRRAIANMFAIQLALSAKDDCFEEDLPIILGYLNRFQVQNDLNKMEQALFDGDYDRQVLLDIAWTYESFWALAWALGLIDNISDASEICDCLCAFRLVIDCHNFDEFWQKCHPREVGEILDMLDLYYRYHWACVEKQIHPQTSIGNLNGSVVQERRRGLEWLISEEDDWFSIQLDT